jgi:hypothetical protein
MSHVDPSTPYRDTRHNRKKVNTSLWSFGRAGSSAPPFGRCSKCLEQTRLVLKDVVTDGGTEKKMFCPTCGTTQPFDQTTDVANTGKYASRYGSTSKPYSFIISQPKRKPRVDALADEDRDTIAAAFGSSSVELKESREDYT